MLRGIGSFKPVMFSPAVYILWTQVPCATISPVGKADPLISTPRPHPSLGKLAQAGFPLFYRRKPPVSSHRGVAKGDPAYGRASAAAL